MRKLVDKLRIAAWSLRAARVARRHFRRSGPRGTPALPPVPQTSFDGRGPVLRPLYLVRATCLTRTAVLQRWEAAHGRPRDLLIGVARADGDFAAHAWLDGDPQHPTVEFRELVRISP